MAPRFVKAATPLDDHIIALLSLFNYLFIGKKYRCQVAKAGCKERNGSLTLVSKNMMERTFK